jgi:hypothetical protein
LEALRGDFAPHLPAVGLQRCRLRGDLHRLLDGADLQSGIHADSRIGCDQTLLTLNSWKPWALMLTS